MMNCPENPEETWPASPAIAPGRLVLTWGAREMEVTEKRASLTVGREETNGIVITSGKVSRVHARIEYRNGHFSLIDQSSNGTYIADSGGTRYKVSRETHVLMGNGFISFGIDPASGQAQGVRYCVAP